MIESDSLKLFHDETLFCFDDLVIMPRLSNIESRSSVDTKVTISKNNKQYTFNTPIISSPMSNVTGENMCLAMSEINSMAILHRFQDFSSLLKSVQNLRDKLPVAVAVGVKQNDYDNLPILLDNGVKCICIDVANGVNITTFKFVEYVKKLTDHTDVIVIAGSISDASHIKAYKHYGLNVDGYRVGIGGGSICTTSIQTGHGVPLAYSLYDIQNEFQGDDKDFFIIADGGIRNSGDIVKSLALGADFVMCGSLLAGTHESNAETVTIFNNGVNLQYKKYYGMASKENQKGRDKVYEEGVSHLIPITDSVSNVVGGLMNGVRSGCSYSNCESIKDLSYMAMLRKISPSAIKERKAHIYEI